MHGRDSHNWPRLLSTLRTNENAVPEVRNLPNYRCGNERGTDGKNLRSCPRLWLCRCRSFFFSAEDVLRFRLIIHRLCRVDMDNRMMMMMKPWRGILFENFVFSFMKIFFCSFRMFSFSRSWDLTASFLFSTMFDFFFLFLFSFVRCIIEWNPHGLYQSRPIIHTFLIE